MGGLRPRKKRDTWGQRLDFNMYHEIEQPLILSEWFKEWPSGFATFLSRWWLRAGQRHKGVAGTRFSQLCRSTVSEFWKRGRQPGCRTAGM